MKEEKQINPFAWIYKYAGEKQSEYIKSVVLAFCGAICQVLPFYIVAKIIQKLLNGNQVFSSYLLDLGLLFLFWILRIVFHGLSTRASHVATFNVLGNMRKKGLVKLAKMPLGDVRHKGSGELKNILVERIDSIETILAHMIPEVSSNLFVLIMTIIYLFVIDWRMALASLITLPIGIICFMLMMIGYEENFGRTVRATKALNDTAVEYIGGIEVIKVFGKAKSSYEKFVAAAKEGAASYVDWMRKSNVYFTFAMNIMPATLIAVLPIGGYFVYKGTLTLDTFILVTIVAMGLVTPIIGIAMYNDDMSKLGTIIGEITSITEADELPRPLEDENKVVSRDMTLEDVHFGYEKDCEVLHGINATFKVGTVNALVGPSGGGKSTIAKLIASFWDPTSGCIRIGGVDIRQLSSETYHRLIAYVSQENFLFNDTVRENIRMGCPSATDEEVEQAAKDCGCYDFIMNLENGFDTVVGSAGGHLSGGEKQRISIARAMLKNAPIIILDEATAYTDPENEALIQRSVAKLVQGRTLIVIAHRLSTIVDADQICVIKDGNIEASGTHQELLDHCDLYRSLWEAHISSKDDGGVENV